MQSSSEWDMTLLGPGSIDLTDDLVLIADLETVYEVKNTHVKNYVAAPNSYRCCRFDGIVAGGFSR